MHNSLVLFSDNLNRVRNLDRVYEYLSKQILDLVSFDDLLRFQIVYAVSAFDKLIHDFVRIGMVQIFSGSRTPTDKYLSETMPVRLYIDLMSATAPPREFLFEAEVVNKLKKFSFQEPDRVAEGLSYIWNEPHKWQKIAISLGKQDGEVRKRLKLIVDRRNMIVHEADIDLISKMRHPISRSECNDVTNFLDLCGRKIYELIQ